MFNTSYGATFSLDETIEVNNLYLAGEEDRRQDHTSHKILRQQREALKEARDKLDQVVNYLNFIQNIKSNEALDLLCKEINELISKTNTAIRARKNRRKGDEEGE